VIRPIVIIIAAVVGCVVLVLLIALALRSDGTVWGREHTIAELKRLRDRVFVNPTDAPARSLLEEALRSKSRFRRVEAAAEIGSLGEKGRFATDALVGALETDDRFTAREIVQALGEIGPTARACLPQLIAVMESNPSRDVGWFAADSIGQIADQSDRSALEALSNASHSSDSNLAVRASHALQSIKERNIRRSEAHIEGRGGGDSGRQPRRE